ncbi:MAG: HK97 family phage prohead protease [Nitrospinota bacterium]
MPATNWIALDDWKAKLAEGQAPEECALRKALIPEEIKQVEGKSRTIRFTISTSAVDRDRDTIDASGWKLANYKKNPVVLWAHSYHELPVAKASKISKQEGKLVADAEFATAEQNPLAESVYQLLLGGFLNAASVGFKPLKTEFNEERRGVDFLEQELLEFSVVPVPANPEALIEARGMGLDVEPLTKWAKAVLEGLEKVVPGNASSERAPEDTPWRAPRLQDFTDESWDDLSASQRSRIARHFAWAKAMPPETFGDLKLPHHRAQDGNIVWRGVAAAMAALLGGRGGVNIPAGDKRPVYNHLAAHYRAFDKPVPDFRFVEIEILKSEPDRWQFDEDTGGLLEIADDPEQKRRSQDLFIRNTRRIESAQTHGNKLCGLLGQVIEDLRAGHDDDDDDGKTAGEPPDTLTLEIEDVIPDNAVLELEDEPGTVDIDPDDFRDALRDLVGSGVREAFNALTGRVD